MEELIIREGARDPESKAYSLTQYTEHIHFQANEKGACLRGTEVKPKLDKFIDQYCEKNEVSIPKSCYLSQPGEKLLSLNYSVSISPAPGREPVINLPRTRESAFFANEGNVEIKRYSVFYPDGLVLKIHCRKQRIGIDIGARHFEYLMDLIDYALPAFFALTCFGTRSTKGFGSYGIKGRVADHAYLKQFAETYYHVSFPGKRDKMPEIIKTLSNMMKAGLNNSFQNRYGKPSDDFYYKGRIFRYFTERGIGSDKAFMKQNLLPGQDKSPRSEEKTKYETFVYSRGILGLAPLYEFRSGAGSTRQGKVTVEDGAAGRSTIERFNNPVHFKPNGEQLLIIPTPIPEVMGGHTFTFAADNGNRRSLKTPVVSKANSKEPVKGEFRLEAFLDYFMKEYNAQKDMIGSDRRVKRMFQILCVNNRPAKMYKAGGGNV